MHLPRLSSRWLGSLFDNLLSLHKRCNRQVLEDRDLEERFTPRILAQIGQPAPDRAVTPKHFRNGSSVGLMKYVAQLAHHTFDGPVVDLRVDSVDVAG